MDKSLLQVVTTLITSSNTLSFSLLQNSRRRKKITRPLKETRENPYNSLKNYKLFSPILSSLFSQRPQGSIYRLQRMRLSNLDRGIKTLAQRPDSCRGSAAKAAFPRQNLGRCTNDLCCHSITVCLPCWIFQKAGDICGRLQIWARLWAFPFGSLINPINSLIIGLPLH